MSMDRAHVAQAIVETAKASGYLQQLCKHFGHKIPVEFDARRGRIEFPMGICDLEASEDADVLTLRASAATAEKLARVKEVVASHLLRFAFREELKVDWTPPERGRRSDAALPSRRTGQASPPGNLPPCPPVPDRVPWVRAAADRVRAAADPGLHLRPRRLAWRHSQEDCVSCSISTVPWTGAAPIARNGT